MGWKQKINFNLAKMGKQSGWCEKNVREGYGLPAKCKDAKADMEFNKSHGALHPMSELPKNVDVPVFVDTPSVNKHVEVSVKGVLYSDGKKVSNPNSQKYFGWGEYCATARVVEFVKDPTPAPAKKTNEQIADEVIAGKWGNGVDRKNRLIAAGYDYNAVQAIVNRKVKGGSSAIKVGDKVSLIKLVDYNGRALRVTSPAKYVKQISGDRVVLAAGSVNGGVYAAVKMSNLRRV